MTDLDVLVKIYVDTPVFDTTGMCWIAILHVEIPQKLRPTIVSYNASE